MEKIKQAQTKVELMKQGGDTEEVKKMRERMKIQNNVRLGTKLNKR